VGKTAGSNDMARATDVIAKSFKVDASPKALSSRSHFSIPIVRLFSPVLRQLIVMYRQKHVAVHQASGILDDFLREQTKELRLRLQDTQEKLAKLKNETGIISLEETKKSYQVRITKLQDDILATEAQLAGRQAALEKMEKASLQSDEEMSTVD